MERLDLRSLRYYCLYSKEERRNHVKKQFDKVGIAVEFVHGPTSYNGRKVSRICGAIGHARVIDKALRDSGRNFTPFAIIEDDVTWTDRISIAPCIDVPSNADSVFIGISECNLKNNIDVNGAELLWETCGSVDVVRVYNMLSTHAIVFMTPAYAAAYTRCMIEAANKSSEGGEWDCVSSRLSPYYNIFATPFPYLYQDAIVGGQEKPTKTVLKIGIVEYLSSKLREYKNYSCLSALYDGCFFD